MNAGERVEILTGLNGGTEGVVSWVRAGRYGGDVVDVRMTVPVLLMQPDGPTREVVLPYAPAELRVLS